MIHVYTDASTYSIPRRYRTPDVSPYTSVVVIHVYTDSDLTYATYFTTDTANTQAELEGVEYCLQHYPNAQIYSDCEEAVRRYGINKVIGHTSKQRLLLIDSEHQYRFREVDKEARRRLRQML